MRGTAQQYHNTDLTGTIRISTPKDTETEFYEPSVFDSVMTTYSNRFCLCLRKLGVLLKLKSGSQAIITTDIIITNIILTIVKKTIDNEKMSPLFTTKNVL
jgi:hypothetical protein